MILRTTAVLAVLCGLTLFCQKSLGQEQCPPLPHAAVRELYDINNPEHAGIVELVNIAHFQPEVENLVRGTTGTLPGDLVFILGSIPNHHRALISMGRWQTERGRPRGAGYPDMDCYFKRAFQFAPRDSQLYFVQGIYLQRLRKYPEARRAYARAEEMGVSSPELFYNRGLLEANAGDIKAARIYADKAYALGYPLPGLRIKLKSMGVRLDAKP
jgi:tetratricopeptide (TPR) repeat protein